MGTKLDPNEIEGIAAIKYLQGLADVTETDTQARAGWKSMDEGSQKFTLDFYHQLKKTKIKIAKPIVADLSKSSPDATARVTHDRKRKSR